MRTTVLTLRCLQTPIEVQAIFNETEEEIPSAIAGDNVRIRVRGVEEDDVSVGFVCCEPRKPVPSVTQFQAQLAILESKNIICAGYSAVMHVHTMSEEVTLTVRLPSVHCLCLLKVSLTSIASFIRLFSTTMTRRQARSLASLRNSPRRVRKWWPSLRPLPLSALRSSRLFKHSADSHSVTRVAPLPSAR